MCNKYFGKYRIVGVQRKCGMWDLRLLGFLIFDYVMYPIKKNSLGAQRLRLLARINGENENQALIQFPIKNLVKLYEL